MRKLATVRLCGMFAAALMAWLNGPGWPTTVLASDTNIDGASQLINEGGVTMKVETDAIGAPPPPSEYLIYAQRPGVVFPATVGGCTIYSPTSYFCPPVDNIINRIPCLRSGCFADSSSPSMPSCTDGCSYCWQQGYHSCT